MPARLLNGNLIAGEIRASMSVTRRPCDAAPVTILTPPASQSITCAEKRCTCNGSDTWLSRGTISSRLPAGAELVEMR